MYFKHRIHLVVFKLDPNYLRFPVTLRISCKQSLWVHEENPSLLEGTNSPRYYTHLFKIPPDFVSNHAPILPPPSMGGTGAPMAKSEWLTLHLISVSKTMHMIRLTNNLLQQDF